MGINVDVPTGQKACRRLFLTDNGVKRRRHTPARHECQLAVNVISERVISDASYAVTDGRTVRRSAGTGGSGTASVPCAS